MDLLYFDLIAIDFLPRGPINDKLVIVNVWIVAWSRTADKSLSESMMVQCTDVYA